MVEQHARAILFECSENVSRNASVARVASQKDWSEVNVVGPEDLRENITNEGPLRLTLDDDINTDHEWRSPPSETNSGVLSWRGRPPRTFFCHSSPSV